MSFVEDEIEFYALEAEEYQYMIDLIYEGIWTTKEGKRLNIDNMSEYHINNCLRLFGKNTQRGIALRTYLS